MKQHYLLFGASTLMAAGLAACVDNAYDLSDIDTNTRLTINDLVIPVNIDDVTLGDIITYDEDSRIKAVTMGGKTFYALTESGSFDSDPIHIDKVTADAPVLDPTTERLQQVAVSGRAAAGMTATYEIVNMGNAFSYKAFDVDEAIVELDAADTDPMRFVIHLDAVNVSDEDVDIEFEDLVIKVAKGLTATTSVGEYDAETGLWTIAEHHMEGKSTEAVLTATSIDFKANSAEIDANHSFNFNSEFKVQSGYLTLKAKTGVALPDELDFKASYRLDDIVVNAFDGKLNYHIDGLSIDPVSLADLPDFLSGDETSVHLANPQLYLSLNNPIAGEKLNYRTGLSITAVRDNYRDLEFPLDNGVFTVGYEHGVAGPYNLVFAPSDKDLSTPDEYAENLSYQPYTDLSDILSVDTDETSAGLPDELVVNVNDPQIPLQPVIGFRLGRDLEGVKGRYEFVAPLDLTDESLITYSERRDGWNDETLDAVTVTKLSLTAAAVNNTPLNAVVEATPIDVDGNPIKGAVVKSNTLAANTKTDIVIELTGEIRNLDGVILKATVRPGSDHKVLEPSQTIKLTNVRARVAGYYEKEL